MPEAFALHTTKSDNVVPKQNMMHHYIPRFRNEQIEQHVLHHLF